MPVLCGFLMMTLYCGHRSNHLTRKNGSESMLHENSKSKLSHSFILFKSSILVKWKDSYDLAVSGLIQLIGKQACYM